MSRILQLCLLAFALASARAAETLPPAPARYFNDYSGTVTTQTAERLNAQLEQFEKETSSQVVVAMFGKSPSETPIGQYAVELGRHWKIGREKENNGALLLVFKDDRKMWIAVGYGLEGAIPDATAKRIIEREITPHFRRGDFDTGLSAGVTAILQAARGEYKGTGTTVAQGKRRGLAPLWVIIPIVIIILVAFSGSRQGTVYHRRRRNRSFWAGPWIGGGGWGGGGSSGGGWSGGGGFSGGGGSFGGGGAGGSW